MLTVMKKSLQRSVKGVQNVYTQHQPYLVQQLDSLLKGGTLLSEACCCGFDRCAAAGPKLVIFAGKQP